MLQHDEVGLQLFHLRKYVWRNKYPVVPPSDTISFVDWLRLVHYLFLIITWSILPPPCLLDAQKLTSALRALEELDLELVESSGDAVQEWLFVPTLKKLNLRVVSDHVTTVPMLIGFGPDCSVYLPISALLHWLPVKPSSQVRVACYTVEPAVPLWSFCLPW